MNNFVASVATTVAASQQQLTFLGAYGLVVLGSVVSILLPILVSLLPHKPEAAAAVLPPWWSIVKPYVVIGAVSLVAAVIVIAFAGDAAKDWSWQAALLAGYAWDSTLQKVGKR